MVRITVDAALCENHGRCVFTVGDVFMFNDKGEMEHLSEADESRRDLIEAAAEICPVQAITVE